MTDAVTWLESRRRKAWFNALLIFLAVEPTLAALIGRALKGKHWLGDYEAVLCGARAVAAGVSPYQPHTLCPDMKAAAYVYPPQLAQATAPLLEMLGLDAMRWLYALILIPASAFLIWFAVLKPFPNAPLSLRLLGLMAIRGSPLATGNFGGVLQAAMVWASLYLNRLRWVFITVVIAAGCVKPAFLTTLVVLLCERRPLKARVATFALACALGLAALAVVFVTAGPIMDEWRALIQEVLKGQPGRGFIALLPYLGLHASHPITYGLYIPLAAALTLAAVIMSDHGDLNDAERVLLGLGMAQMLNPRLFEYDYDMYLLYPALALVVMMAAPLHRRAFVWLSWTFATVMVGNFLISLIGINVIKYFPGTWLTGCVLIGVTTWLMVRGRTPLQVLQHSLDPPERR